MKSFILNLTYALMLVLATPWLIWRAFKHGKNRRGWSQKLWGLIHPRDDVDDNTDCIWFHAVSVAKSIC